MAGAGAFLATCCQGTVREATMAGLEPIWAKVWSSRRTISRSRRTAVRPPITTAIRWVVPRVTELTRLKPLAPVYPVLMPSAPS